MVYRKPEQIADALKEGKMKYKSALQSISRYRKQDDLDSVLLYLVGMEIYRHWCRVNGLEYGATVDWS